MKHLTKSILGSTTLAACIVVASVGLTQLAYGKGAKVKVGAPSISKTKIYDFLDNIIEENNKTLPKYIDSITVMESSLRSGGEMKTLYGIDFPAFYKDAKIEEGDYTFKEITEYMDTTMFGTLHNTVCYNTKKLDLMREYDLSYKYVYTRYSDGRYMFNIKVSVESCTYFIDAMEKSEQAEKQKHNQKPFKVEQTS